MLNKIILSFNMPGCLNVAARFTRSFIIAIVFYIIVGYVLGRGNYCITG